MIILQRQRIDATYTTGSGRRKDEDILDEEEQAICDWIGEDISLGRNFTKKHEKFIYFPLGVINCNNIDKSPHPKMHNVNFSFFIRYII